MLPTADTGRSLYLAPNKVPKWSLRAFSCWVLISFIPYCAASSRSKEVAWISSADGIFSDRVMEMQLNLLYHFSGTSASSNTLHGNDSHTVSFNRKFGESLDKKMITRILPKQIEFREKKNILNEDHYILFSLLYNSENYEIRMWSPFVCTSRHKVEADP